MRSAVLIVALLGAVAAVHESNGEVTRKDINDQQPNPPIPYGSAYGNPQQQQQPSWVPPHSQPQQQPQQLPQQQPQPQQPINGGRTETTGLMDPIRHVGQLASDVVSGAFNGLGNAASSVGGFGDRLMQIINGASNTILGAIGSVVRGSTVTTNRAIQEEEPASRQKFPQPPVAGVVGN